MPAPWEMILYLFPFGSVPRRYVIKKNPWSGVGLGIRDSLILSELMS